MVLSVEHVSQWLAVRGKLEESAWRRARVGAELVIVCLLGLQQRLAERQCTLQLRQCRGDEGRPARSQLLQRAGIDVRQCVVARRGQRCIDEGGQLLRRLGARLWQPLVQECPDQVQRTLGRLLLDEARQGGHVRQHALPQTAQLGRIGVQRALQLARDPLVKCHGCLAVQLVRATEPEQQKVPAFDTHKRAPVAPGQKVGHDVAKRQLRQVRARLTAEPGLVGLLPRNAACNVLSHIHHSSVVHGMRFVIFRSCFGGRHRHEDLGQDVQRAKRAQASLLMAPPPIVAELIQLGNQVVQVCQRQDIARVDGGRDNSVNARHDVAHVLDHTPCVWW